jgi:hypothetical protein
MGFHVVMGMSGHESFSVIAPALLFPFVPEDLPARLEAAFGRFPTLRRGLSGAGRVLVSGPSLLLAAAVWLAVATAHTVGWLPTSTLGQFVYGGFGIKLLYYPYAFALSGAFLLCALEGRPSVASLRLRPIAALGPLLIVLNGLSPYLGLKTEHSFTMFSNLQTEGDQWNHLFMPRWLRIFDLQDELVAVLETNDERLRAVRERGDRLIYFELHRYLSEHPEVGVTFEHAGRRISIERVADHPEISVPPSLLARKLLAFRDVAPREHNTVRH